MTEQRAEPGGGGHTATRQASGGACHTGEAVLCVTRLEQAADSALQEGCRQGGGTPFAVPEGELREPCLKRSPG